MVDGPYRRKQNVSHRSWERRNWIAKQMYRQLLRLVGVEGGQDGRD